MMMNINENVIMIALTQNTCIFTDLTYSLSIFLSMLKAIVSLGVYNDSSNSLLWNALDGVCSRISIEDISALVGLRIETEVGCE